MKTVNIVYYCAMVLALAGCGGAKMAESTPGADPRAAVSEATELYQQAEQTQADLLSFKEYSRGSENLEKARKGLSGDYERQYILEKATLAKTHLQLALDQAWARKSNAERLLEVRRAALGAGLRNSPALVAALAKVDDDLRNETDDFARALAPRDFSEFQKKYFSLEVKAVQFRELDDVSQAIRKADNDDADKLAPNSLRTAMLDLNEAENLIAQSPRDPSVHGPSVDKAIASSVLLTDVMAVILNARGTPENIALKIVYQNRELEKLSTNVGNLEQNLKATTSSLSQTEGTLKKQQEAMEKQQEVLEATKSNLMETETALVMQNEQLEKTSTQVRFQKAMDEAVRQFSEDEASVYQQGSKLIFRLKQINFASGNATIPEASKPLLVKINSIIKSVGAELVAVEGHTDSVGATDLNADLSTRRAISVANYLASLAGGYKIGYIGYGESRPIASNETREGRAINRRVDLVVTAKKSVP
ncbi:MAG: OmpA family protein [Gammaproteobacteria bacterium]|nr:OmpA family protein [Gammaproteobacteria bacterium]